MINANKNFCYRITHISNIAEILECGLCSKHHPAVTGKYVSIGNPGIISLRDKTPVKLAGYGNIGEYVPFYFTPKSMMLFNIVTGYQAPVVPKQKKEDIVVVRCLIQKLSTLEKYFFTDGQANVAITDHYNKFADLANIDWSIIQNCDFKKEASDTDKQRRYQAEFLVHSHVPVNFIDSLHVYNQKAYKMVQRELAKTQYLLPIQITTQYFF